MLFTEHFKVKKKCISTTFCLSIAKLDIFTYKAALCVCVCVLEKKSTKPLPDILRHIGVSEASN